MHVVVILLLCLLPRHAPVEVNRVEVNTYYHPETGSDVFTQVLYYRDGEMLAWDYAVDVNIIGRDIFVKKWGYLIHTRCIEYTETDYDVETEDRIIRDDAPRKGLYGRQ